MKYAAVYRSWLQSEALEATSETLGAWLRLAVIAADKELPEPGPGDVGWGRIPGCGSWSHLAWLRGAGLTLDEANQVVDAGLAAWDGQDLLISGFDLKGLRAVQSMRKGGRKAAPGRPRINTEKKRVSKPFQGPFKGGSKPLSNPKGKEGLDREGGGGKSNGIGGGVEHWGDDMDEDPSIPF